MRALARGRAGYSFAGLSRELRRRLRIMQRCRIAPSQRAPVLSDDILNIVKAHAGEYFTASEFLPNMLDGLVADAPELRGLVELAFLCVPPLGLCVCVAAPPTLPARRSGHLPVTGTRMARCAPLMRSCLASASLTSARARAGWGISGGPSSATAKGQAGPPENRRTCRPCCAASGTRERFTARAWPSPAA